QTISKLAQPKSIFVPKGTVICSIQGTIGRVAITQYDAYVDRTIAIFESYKININKKYFAYCIQLKFSKEKKHTRGSTLKNIKKYNNYVNRTIAIFESYKININKKYFAYCIQLKFSKEKKLARGSTLKTITKEEFTKFKIPVLPLKTQDEIVRILDNFIEVE